MQLQSGVEEAGREGVDVPMQGDLVNNVRPAVRTGRAVVRPGGNLDLGEEAGGGQGDVQEEQGAFLDCGHGCEGGGGGG